MKYKKFDALRQKLDENRWLEKHRPYDKIEGINPFDRDRASGIIPIPPAVYAPAGGFKKIGQGLLRDEL